MRDSQAVWDLTERRRREGWDEEQSGEGERVSGKLLIKYESILEHLSGHESTSPLRGETGMGVEGGIDKADIGEE